MKIIYIMPRCTKSGPIQVLENIIKFMDRNKFDIYIITIEPENRNRTILESFAPGSQKIYVPVNKIKALLNITRKLKKVIDTINPDIIHSTGIIPDFIVNKNYSDKQLVISHANVKIDYRYLCGKVIAYFMSELHIHIMRKAKTTIACSKSLSDIYKKEENLSIDYIRNGIICSLDGGNSDKDKLREKIRLPLNKFLFVYAASFNKRKNHKFLLKIFSHMNNTDNALVLLGDGPTYNELVREYNNYENIIFLGRVTDVPKYLRACDYFVSSSIQEGMPMGVLEAMNEGLPVILSDIDQHKEIFFVNKEIGILYKSNDEEDFYNKMECIKQMDYYNMSKNAQSVIQREFNAELMSEQYQKEYKKIARKIG